MATFVEIIFQCDDIDLQDMLIALLSKNGYEGFEQDDKVVKAFVHDREFDKNIINDIASQYKVSFTINNIEETNWNRLWESNFEPVRLDDFVGIRADFHDTIEGVDHEIIITPKMSFGTGHHATTSMMIRQMKDIDFAGKRVLDFGTGTGILAVLAEQMGAKEIIAIDCDEWSITNAGENCTRNNCHNVKLEMHDTAVTVGSFDIILANINKNIILSNIHTLVAQLVPEGILLVSGLLTSDENDIVTSAQDLALKKSKMTTEKNWISIRFQS